MEITQTRQISTTWTRRCVHCSTISNTTGAIQCNIVGIEFKICILLYLVWFRMIGISIYRVDKSMQ